MDRKAFTREVSPKLAECALTHLTRRPIDHAVALRQHEQYEAVLRDCGLKLVRLPPLPDHPDGVFVEDTAILLNDHAIITRPGALSRAAETSSTAQGLAGEFEVVWLPEGTLDGGDVLRIHNTIYVGLSTRTSAQGANALRDAAVHLGFSVVPTDVRHCLHLKSAATFAGPDPGGNEVLVYDPSSIDHRQFAGVEAVAVAQGERCAANVLRVNDRLIIPAGNHRTVEGLRQRGFDITQVDVSELQKAEAGVTCMSLVGERSVPR